MNTPGSKNITPCRRMGLSRNFRRSTCTPGSAKEQETPVIKKRIPNVQSELKSTPLCSIKMQQSTAFTTGEKRMITMKSNFKPKLKKKKLEFIDDDLPKQMSLNTKNENLSIEVSPDDKLFFVGEDKENNVDLGSSSKSGDISYSQISSSQINELELEVSKMNIELEKLKKHENEVNILKSLITQWKNGLRESLEILSYKTNPPQQFSNILKAFNISPDILL